MIVPPMVDIKPAITILAKTFVIRQMVVLGFRSEQVQVVSCAIYRLVQHQLSHVKVLRFGTPNAHVQQPLKRRQPHL
jgi:hypothetical protein